MSNFMGASTGQPVATQATRYNGMQVQGSQYGLGLTIVYGQQRIPGNLIWYGDFQSVEHAQSVGKGGGGVSTSYTYSSSFQLALCEGPVSGLVTIWKDSGTTTLSDINGTFSAGASGQPAWSHLSGAEALQYTNVAWIGCLNLALGSSPNVPNFNFEIAGMLQYAPTASPPIIDADPAAIFADLLTSPTHGLGFSYLGDLTQYSNYCIANNLFLSLKVDQQTTMNEVLTRLLQITNSDTAWSNGKLTVIPYGDETVTANGVTYTPATAVQKYFQDSDYIKPVRVDRKPLSDLYNVIRVEYVNRANNYNTSVAEAKDQADIDTTFSVRQQEIIQGHAITNGTLAQWVAQTILQRALYIRNTYTFTTTMENVAFEPGDVIALTDSQAELLNEPVRIKSISEQGTNELQFVCEEFPAGVAVGATQTVEPAAGYVPNVNGAPDATQPALIFRAPQFLTNGVAEVWIGVGGSGPNWGGANILVSLDDVSYSKIGTVAPGCRYGELTAALADSTADPDTTDSFSVSLYAGGTLSGGTDADADNLATLMLIDQELVAYSSTILNGDGTYTLGNGYLRRQCYQTAHAAHAIGAPWIRVDNSVFRWQVDPSWVGQTVYIKIQPWNLYGGGLVSESDLTPITYVVGTAEEIPDTPPTPTSFVASGAVNGVLLTWDNPNPAAVAITSVEASTDGTTWSVLGQVQGTHYAHVFSGNANWYYRIRARSSAFIWSGYTSTVSATGGSVDYGADGSAFVRLLASRAAGNVAYNFRGIWSATTAYLKGDEVVEGQTYWVATAANTNSMPATNNSNWQSVGSYSAYQGAWNSTTAYVPGSEVTDGGNYWICVTGNTNSAPSTSNADWVLAGPQALDNVADGPTTYYRVPLSHFDNATNRNWNLGYTIDGPNRFAVVNASGLGGVSYWDGNNNPRIDFTGTYHIGKSLANVPDATGRYAVTNMAAGNAVSYVDGNNNPRVDFSGTYHLFKNLDNIGDGSTYARTVATALYGGRPVSFSGFGASLASQADTPTSGWAASTAYALNAQILDSNGNVQECVVAGTSGTTAPTWSTSQGATVTDGSVTWMMVGAGSRFAVTNMAAGNAVSYVDGNNNPRVDFS
ncbi:MAG: phage tail protein, partial [Steroidobacteraceae bacterium]